MLFAALPVSAGVCYLAGWIVFAACWLGMGTVWVFTYSALIAGIFTFMLGLVCQGMLGHVRRYRLLAHCVPHVEALVRHKILLIIGGIISSLLGGVCLYLSPNWYPILQQSADTAWAVCQGAAWFLYADIFVAYDVYIWAWSVLAGALLNAGVLLATMMLLRLEAPLKYIFGKIGYACPTCHHQGVPYFCCPRCATLIRDLHPTPYGIWQARCTCGKKLPTVDLAGRLSLAKVCRGCQQDLDEVTFGRDQEFHFGIVGATGSGKSSWLAAAVWQLTSFAHQQGFELGFSDSTKRVYHRWVEQFEQGKVLQKTAVIPKTKAFTLILRHKGSPGCRIYFYDVAGDNLSTKTIWQDHSCRGFLTVLCSCLPPLPRPVCVITSS
jgi:hypothetical protein